MKQLLKKFLPEKMHSYLKQVQLLQYYYYDYKLYSRSAFGITRKTSLENCRAKITLSYHSIEKGLSNNNIRLGFGKKALNSLFSSLEEYIKLEFPTEDIRFKTAITVLTRYIEYHKENGYNVDAIELRLNKIDKRKLEKLGGVVKYKKDDIIKYSNSDFSTLAFNRISVRDFSEEPVDINLVNSALEIATKTPSVCNRQPWNTYIIKDKKLSKEILALQEGLDESRRSKIDTLIAVTANNSYLNGSAERNQGFIDGGLFSMSLIYALQHKELATCALNADLPIENDKKIRELLRIPDNQIIILFIAVGNYPQEFSVPKSYRDNYKEFTKYYI